jgi:cell division protease FtsH
MFQILNNKAITGVTQVGYAPSQEAPWWAGIISTLLPILLLIGFFFFLFQKRCELCGRMTKIVYSHTRLLNQEKNGHEDK